MPHTSSRGHDLNDVHRELQILNKLLAAILLLLQDSEVRIKPKKK